MLDIKFIRDNLEVIQEVIKNKNRKDVDLKKLLELDERRKEFQIKLDQLRSQRNEMAKIKAKPTPQQIQAGKDIKDKITKMEETAKTNEEQFYALLVKIPNVVSKDTPIGKNEEENVVLRQVGKTPKFNFQTKDHMELSVMHGLIDTEKSAEISGSRFNYLFGEAAMLQFALIQYTLATLTNEKLIAKLAKNVKNPSNKPFKPVIVPDFIKSEIMKKMDRFEPLEDRYYFEEDDILLIGSAEHTLGPLHMNEIIDEENLPIRYIGYSTAFRREAGSYGKDTTGIMRRHQFDKLEIECFTTPQNGQAEQDLIVALQEYMLKKLELPYQVVSICTGDMGKPDFRQIDIECYMPGQKKYRETHTSDYMTDYQARRLNIKYKDKEGKKELVHMNDATAFAVGRILIAILENNQQKDGSIKIPKALQPYMPGNLKIIKVK